MTWIDSLGGLHNRERLEVERATEAVAKSFRRSLDQQRERTVVDRRRQLRHEAIRSAVREHLASRDRASGQQDARRQGEERAEKQSRSSQKGAARQNAERRGGISRPVLGRRGNAPREPDVQLSELGGRDVVDDAVEDAAEEGELLGLEGHEDDSASEGAEEASFERQESGGEKLSEAGVARPSRANGSSPDQPAEASSPTGPETGAETEEAPESLQGHGETATIAPVRDRESSSGARRSQTMEPGHGAIEDGATEEGEADETAEDRSAAGQSSALEQAGNEAGAGSYRLLTLNQYQRQFLQSRQVPPGPGDKTPGSVTTSKRGGVPREQDEEAMEQTSELSSTFGALQADPQRVAALFLADGGGGSAVANRAAEEAFNSPSAASGLRSETIERLTQECVKAIHVHLSVVRPRIDLVLDLGSLGTVHARVERRKKNPRDQGRKATNEVQESVESVGNGPGVSVHFETGGPEARLYLERSLPELGRRLRERQVDVVDLSVGLVGQS